MDYILLWSTQLLVFRITYCGVACIPFPYYPVLLEDHGLPEEVFMGKKTQSGRYMGPGLIPIPSPNPTPSPNPICNLNYSVSITVWIIYVVDRNDLVLAHLEINVPWTITAADHTDYLPLIPATLTITLVAQVFEKRDIWPLEQAPQMGPVNCYRKRWEKPPVSQHSQYGSLCVKLLL